MSVLLLLAAAALLGFAAGIVAGSPGVARARGGRARVYISAGTGADAPPGWMAPAIPAVPFAFMGVGIGIGMRRAAHDGSRREQG